MTESIKGVALQFATARILRGLDEGRLSWDSLDARLHQQDLLLLDEKIIPSLWYSIAAFERMLTFSLAVDGIESDRQRVQVGYQAAKGILTNPIFDTMVSTAAGRGNRAGQTLVGLAPLLLNFSHWSFENESEDGQAFRIDVREAEAFPNGLIPIVQGLIEYLTLRVFDTRLQVTSERPNPDQVGFRTQP